MAEDGTSRSENMVRIAALCILYNASDMKSQNVQRNIIRWIYEASGPLEENSSARSDHRQVWERKI